MAHLLFDRNLLITELRVNYPAALLPGAGMRSASTMDSELLLGKRDATVVKSNLKCFFFKIDECSCFCEYFSRA
jgi:hypothetical protein